MYITDLIKCGMNDEGRYYKHIHEYNQKCIENCLERYFYKEIQLVNPKIIFCFGDIPHKKIIEYSDKIEKLLKHSIIVKKLPHPNAHFPSIKFQNEYYSIITNGLYEAGIISEEEKNDFSKRGNIKIDEHSHKKLEEIRQFLKENGFTINKPHNNYIVSKKINGISFCIQNNEYGLSFHWGNGGNKKLNYELFNRKNNEISKLFPDSTVNIGTKKQEWFRIFIPISKNHYKESILEIINKTKEIMEY